MENSTTQVHKFSVQISTILGNVEKTLIFERIAFILDMNKNKEECKDENGVIWSYSTLDDFHEMYSYINRTKIKNIVDELEKMGLIILRNDNKIKFKKTFSFSLSQKGTRLLEINSDKRHPINIEIAKSLGLNDSILFNHIQLWICNNIKSKTNLREDKYWTFDSIDKLHIKFPYLTRNEIKLSLKRLETKELILSSSFNTHKYDKTKWYTLTEKGVVLANQKVLGFYEKVLGFYEKVQPIPDIEQDKETIIEEKNRTLRNKEQVQAIFDIENISTQESTSFDNQQVKLETQESTLQDNKQDIEDWFSNIEKLESTSFDNQQVKLETQESTLQDNKQVKLEGAKPKEYIDKNGNSFYKLRLHVYNPFEKLDSEGNVYLPIHESPNVRKIDNYTKDIMHNWRIIYGKDFYQKNDRTIKQVAIEVELDNESLHFTEFYS